MHWSPFVSVQDSMFSLNGQPYFAFSFNYPQAMGLAASNRDQLKSDLDNLYSIGINHLRIMAASEGPSSPFRYDPTLQPEPFVYNERVFQGLDVTLDEMSKRNMTATLTLNNFWHWSGGFAQYIAWATGDPTIPYPPSWSPELGNYTLGDWQVFKDFSSKFYHLPLAQRLYQKFIKTIITRRNSINGRLYRDDPTIFSWQLCNEPQLPPQSWIVETSSFIKSLDSNHMVSVGLESILGEKDFMDSHSPSTIDFATFHLWVQNRGVYDMFDASQANLNTAIEWFYGQMNTIMGFANKLKKPIIFEEFGMARDNWYAQDSSPEQVYNPNHPTTHRDAYFKAIFDTIVDNVAAGGLVSGVGIWAYSGIARPGDKWLSDPPHEAPGWYAVYDKDTSTLGILSDFIHKIKLLL